MDESPPKHADAAPPGEPCPHPAGEALLLLAVSSALFLGVTTLVEWRQGTVPGDIAPALGVLAWIAPAYLLVTRRGRDPFVDHHLLARPRGLGLAILVSLLLLGAYVLVVRAVAGPPAGTIDAGEVATRFAFDLVFVALPEEYFFRGVLQPGLDRRPARRLLGAPVGRGLVLAALLFGACHVLFDLIRGAPLTLDRALVFLPGLWFGWLLARTGSIVPGIVAHAAANALRLACAQAWAGALPV